MLPALDALLERMRSVDERRRGICLRVLRRIRHLTSLYSRPERLNDSR